MVKALLYKIYSVQEAPLMLRGQRGRCRNIKGKAQIFGSFSSPRPRPLFLLVAKFEIDNFSVEQILKGNPKILKSSYSTGPRPIFLRCGIL